jgi:hypothetical protein
MYPNEYFDLNFNLPRSLDRNILWFELVKCDVRFIARNSRRPRPLGTSLNYNFN